MWSCCCLDDAAHETDDLCVADHEIGDHETMIVVLLIKRPGIIVSLIKIIAIVVSLIKILTIVVLLVNILVAIAC